jgi:hypothetical protein
LSHPNAILRLPSGDSIYQASSTTVGPQMVWFKADKKYIAFLWKAGPMSSESQNGSITINLEHANTAKITNLVTGRSNTEEVTRVGARLTIDAIPVGSQPIALELSGL